MAVGGCGDEDACRIVSDAPSCSTPIAGIVVRYLPSNQPRRLAHTGSYPERDGCRGEPIDTAIADGYRHVIDQCSSENETASSAICLVYGIRPLSFRSVPSTATVGHARSVLIGSTEHIWKEEFEMLDSITEFQRIDFGYASAQAEARENPALLTDGYLDLHNLSERVASGREWLILGYKGSGKSAIAERLRLIYENEPLMFVDVVNIEDFEYVKFSNIVRSSEALETELPTAWSWILYAYLLNSFFRDQGVSVDLPEEYEQVKSAFSEMGLSPVFDLNTIVRVSSESSFQLTIPRFAEKKWTKKTEAAQVDIRWFVYNLRPFIAKLRSQSKHILVIDGLDDILATSQTQYASIGALIFEVHRINDFLKKNSIPAKIVVLCRTDIFQLLGGANKNKIRQDYAIDLDWNSNPKAPGKSLLVQIGNIRASMSLKRKTDVASKYLPRRIEGKNTLKMLLDMTRHTPRDYLQLLSYVQRSAASIPIQIDEMRNGIREYSSKYFLPEIHDELDGYASVEEIKGITAAIEQIAKRDFSYEDIQRSATDIGWNVSDEELEKVLRVLYECSAIGNVRVLKRTGKRYLSYKYRNRNSHYKKNERIILHRGLWRAFNIQWEPFGPEIDPDVSSDEG